MKRESHAMLAHQTKQVTFLLPKIGTQNETLDSDTEEGCRVAEVGSLSARAKMTIKLSSGAYLLFLAQYTLYLTKNKTLFFARSLPKIA